MPQHEDLDNETMVKRLTVTLDDELHATLEEIAAEQQRTVANLLAFLGAQAVKEWKEQQGK